MADLNPPNPPAPQPVPPQPAAPQPVPPQPVAQQVPPQPAANPVPPQPAANPVPPQPNQPPQPVPAQQAAAVQQPPNPPNPQQQPHPVPVPPIAPFALTPASVNHLPIDYSTSEGVKLYKIGCEKLPLEYDLSSAKMNIFLQQLRNRARKANWVPSLTWTPQNKPRMYFLDHYGEITKDEVVQYVRTYQGQPTRAAQNMEQMFECIVNSLTEAAQATIYASPDEYALNGTPDGLLLLKYIIRNAYIDTNATVTTIKMRLSSLDAHMQEKGSNIMEFNTFVREQRSQLAHRGHQTTDLLVHLFKGYKSATDKTFVDYIARKEDEYNDGNPQRIDANRLMELAENKYKMLVEKDQWNAPTEEQQNILALTAELALLKKNQTKAKPTYKAKLTSSTSPKSKNYAADKSKKKRDEGVPAWKKKAPSGNSPKEKDVEGKHYYWCPHHKLWTMHKPEDCRKKNSSGGSQGGTAPSLQVNHGLSAVLELEENL